MQFQSLNVNKHTRLLLRVHFNFDGLNVGALLNSPTHYRLQDSGTLKLCVLSTGTSSSDIAGLPGKWLIIKGDQIPGKQLRLLLLQSVN